MAFSKKGLFSDASKKLILSERKTVIPITYMAIVLMTYYGPNAELFGNIKLAIWHYQNPITDIEAFVSNVSLLFTVDIISLIINGILLRYFCQINPFKVLKQIQQEFWPAFAITECFVLVEVSKQRTYLIWIQV